MNEQKTPSPHRENSPVAEKTSTASSPKSFQPHEESGEKSPSANGLSEEGRSHRRRSARHQDKSASLQNQRSRQRSSHREKFSPSQTSQRFLWGGYIALGMVALFAAGFASGKKFRISTESLKQPVLLQRVMPSEETQNLLESAFGAMREEDNHQALKDFQKVAERQPALTGIDYLIAESAFRADESALAEVAAKHAIAKEEFADESRVLLALINFNKAKISHAPKPVDLVIAAEAEIRTLASGRLADARVYALWGDLLRSRGSYHAAADAFHQAMIRAVPEDSLSVLSAKEQLARRQESPSKSVPSLSEITAMDGEQTLLAAFAALQQHQNENALIFLERARDLFPSRIFRALMEDEAFVQYHSDPQIKIFLDQELDATSRRGDTQKSDH
jgi:hypothetical protein